MFYAHRWAFKSPRKSSRYNNVQHLVNSFDHRNLEYRPSHRARALRNALGREDVFVKLKGDVQEPESSEERKD